MVNERETAMAQIKQELERLHESPLYAYRKENGYSVVTGEGDLNAAIVLVGEAPGKREAETGRPFVGASGKVLDELLQSIGLDRSAVYITNVVKDRPPENRDPHKEEIELYKPFLMRQLAVIRPRVVATLGRFAMDFVLEAFDMPEKGQKISRLHGKTLQAHTAFGELIVLPLYHPAVALYARGKRATLEEDFQTLKQFV